jgi:hypothetical protein
MINKEIFTSWELYAFIAFVGGVMYLMVFKPQVLFAFFRFQRNIFINLKKERLPDWTKAPEWAKYVAQDQNGTWRWHFQKPKLTNGYWTSNLPTSYNHAGFSKINGNSFEKSLQSKPK